MPRYFAPHKARNGGLPPPKPKVLGLFGSGWQAGAHLEYLCSLFDFEMVKVFSPNEQLLKVGPRGDSLVLVDDRGRRFPWIADPFVISFSSILDPGQSICHARKASGLWLNFETIASLRDALLATLAPVSAANCHERKSAKTGQTRRGYRRAAGFLQSSNRLSC